MANVSEILNELKDLLKSVEKESESTYIPNKHGDIEPTQKQMAQLAKQAKPLSYDQTKLFLGSMPDQIVDQVRKSVIESIKEKDEESYIGGAVMCTPKGIVKLDGKGMMDFFGLDADTGTPVNTKTNSKPTKEYTDDNTTSKFLNHYRAPASISQYFDSLDGARKEAQKYSARHVGTTHVVFDNDTDEIVHTCIVDKEEMYALH
jgi:hypothetical protein